MSGKRCWMFQWALPATTTRCQRSWKAGFFDHESGPECDEKWGVDCRALARKINGLPLIQKCAAYEVRRRFWVRKDVNDLHDSYAGMLTAHGARIG